MAVLGVTNLRKSYGNQMVVAGISFEIKAGECFGLLGPNGAGKTTTLRLCLGLIEPDAGEIQLAGLPIPDQAPGARRRVGVVPQADNLDPDFTVRENLLAYGRYFGLANTEIDARIPELLDLAGLTSKANDSIRTLSGGMKRRLTLARALVNDPDIIFLDEPTTGLDPQARHVIWQGLRKLLSQGKTILLTTHFMDEAERICDRVAIMDEGRLVAEGSPRELISAHIEPHVVELYGDEVDVWAETNAGRLCHRYEKAGETLFCYVKETDLLMHELETEDHLRILRRPANLEDVFLKLTGRELRD